MTSQRVEITTGLISQRKVARELYELGDATIERPLNYRFFSVGDLTIQHRSGGAVVLQAIRNAEAVRDLLRGSGQFEAARLDKARWR